MYIIQHSIFVETHVAETHVAGPHVAGPPVAGPPHVAGLYVAGPHVAGPHVVCKSHDLKVIITVQMPFFYNKKFSVVLKCYVPSLMYLYVLWFLFRRPAGIILLGQLSSRATIHCYPCSRASVTT